MKNKKLNLEDLKVKSFVTDMKTQKSETVKGGFTLGCSIMLCSYPCQGTGTGLSAAHMCSAGVCIEK